MSTPEKQPAPVPARKPPGFAERLPVLLAVLLIGIAVGWRLRPTHHRVDQRTGWNSQTFPVTTGLVAQASYLDILERNDKVVTNGLDTLIQPREIESLFGATNVDHFISSLGVNGHGVLWNSVAYFGGRYVLALQVPIEVDYDRCQITGTLDSPFIQINEVTRVEFSKSGIAGARMHGQWRLSENEWKWLVKNHGDWSVVKIPISTASPVKDFDEFARQARAPRRDRKEGYDKPVREALEKLRQRQSATNTGNSLIK